ncbi:MAG TPA: transglutaminase-like cysteine peptidase [Xanthobacteraceae bacterium]|jgi:predicted transglutaminase-like cysteine proteinase|nr:transglutaminase-like cysteine peptidase [Xanthobacteraceae bacterium]
MFGRVASRWGAVWLAALLACVPVRSAIEAPFERPADIVADALSVAFAPDIASVSTEEPLPDLGLFGLASTRMANGDISAKWKAVSAQIAVDNETLAHCRAHAQTCRLAARKFLTIVDEGLHASGRARIGIVNRAVNLAIEPMSDMAQWGVADRWSPPLETFATGRGDCEDYAIAKYVALTAAGVPAKDVKLVIVHNTAANEDHAITAVQIDGDWVLLDNRWLTLVADKAMRQATPLFVLDDDGVRKFTPPVVAGTPSEPRPASL